VTEPTIRFAAVDANCIAVWIKGDETNMISESIGIKRFAHADSLTCYSRFEDTETLQEAAHKHGTKLTFQPSAQGSAKELGRKNMRISGKNT
jgi:hypothetical protein